MNSSTKLNLVSEVNGTISISNDETKITIHPDGTVAISSSAPLQLTGASLAKLDYGQGGDAGCRVSDVLRWLGTRLNKKN